MMDTAFPQSRRLTLVWWLLSAVIVAIVLFAGIFLYAYGRFGTSLLAWQYLSGKSVLYSPHNVIVDESGGLENTGFTFAIWNLRDKPLKVIGIIRSCSCINIDASSAVIDAGESHDFKISVDPSELNPDVVYRVEFVTDDSLYDRLILLLSSGRIRQLANL